MSSHDKNAFIELENLLLDTGLAVSSLKKVADTDEYASLLENFELLKEIVKFRDSYSWLSHSKTVSRVKAYHKSGFKPREAIKLLKENKEVTVTAFETSMWYAAKKFKDSIGDTTLKLISEDKPAEAAVEFRIKTGNLSLESIIARDIVTLLPEPSQIDGMIHTSECKRELRVLKQLTLKYVKLAIDSRSSDNFAFLRYVLEGVDSRYSKQRELIYKFLEEDGADSFDELILKLRQIEIGRD